MGGRRPRVLLAELVRRSSWRTSPRVLAELRSTAFSTADAKTVRNSRRMALRGFGQRLWRHQSAAEAALVLETMGAPGRAVSSATGATGRTGASGIDALQGQLRAMVTEGDAV